MKTIGRWVALWITATCILAACETTAPTMEAGTTLGSETDAGSVDGGEDEADPEAFVCDGLPEPCGVVDGEAFSDDDGGLACVIAAFADGGPAHVHVAHDWQDSDHHDRYWIVGDGSVLQQSHGYWNGDGAWTGDVARCTIADADTLQACALDPGTCTQAEAWRNDCVPEPAPACPAP